MVLNTVNREELTSGKWDKFILHSPQGAPFILYDYLSAIAPEWKALIVSLNGEWQAVMPIEIKRKYGFSYILQPPFSQHSGICYIDKVWKKRYEEYSWKHQVGNMIAQSLESYHWVQVNFSPDFDDPLPFYWAGFSLRTRLTYELTLPDTAGDLYQHFAAPLKRQIRKAEKQGLIFQSTCRDMDSMKSLVRINEEAGNFVLGKHPRRWEILNTLVTKMMDTSYGHVFQIKSREGIVLAAGVYLVYRDRMYYLAGAYHPEGRLTGAMSFLMWKAMCKALDFHCKIFDFEGSMIKGIEQFFRKFGSYPKQYLQIHRNQLPLPIRWIQEFIT